MRDVRKRLGALGIAVAVAAAIVVVVNRVEATEVAQAPDPIRSRPGGPDGLRRLTLPTGDRLVVRPGDSVDAIGRDPADPPALSALHRFRRNGERYAIPVAAVGKVVSGQLSREAFNVDRLLGNPARRGEPAARTADPTLHRLTVSIVDRSGTAENAYASFANLDTGEAGWFAGPGDTLELPAGRYSVLSFAAADAAEPSMYAIPEFRLSGDAGISVDHRRTDPVTLNVDNPLANKGLYGVGFGQVVANVGLVDNVFVDGDLPETRIYAGAAPVTGPTPGFRFYTRAMLEQRAIDLRITAPQAFDVRTYWLVDSPRPTITASLPVAYAGRGSEAELTAAGVGGKLVVIDLPFSATAEAWTAIVASVARAGGRFVALRGVADPASASTSTSTTAAGAVTLALPTVILENVPAKDRLVALAQAGPVHADLKTIPASPFQYQLGYVDRDGPVATTRTVRTADLAAVPVAYHGARPAEVYSAPTYLPGTVDALLSGGYSHQAQSRRTEYYTPGPWGLSVTGPVSGPVAWDQLAASVTLTRGQNPPIGWNAAVVGPSVRGSKVERDGTRPWAKRDGDVIDVLLPMYTDGAGHPRPAGFVRGDYHGQPGVVRLYRNGTLVGEVPQAGIATFEVPKAAADYRLFAEATAADTAEWPLSNRVSAEWTFRSAADPRPVALSLLAVRYAPVVDLTNAAPAGRQVRIPVTVERQDGSPPASVTALTVEVSTDDGATWQPPGAFVKKGDAWELTVANPGRGHVSLRARATDSAGNSVTQTVIRAYRVR